MPENTEKVPGQNDELGKTEQGAGKGAAQAKAPGDDLRAELEAERRKREDAERQYANLRTLQSRQAAELGEFRRQAEAASNAQRETGAEAPEIDPNSLTFASDLAMVKFRQEHDDWKEYWDEVYGMITDPVRAPQVASYKIDPRTRQVVPDFDTSLRNAYRDVKMARYEKAQAEARAKKAELDAKNESNKRNAVISGMSAADVDLGIDLDKASADDVLQAAVKAGLVDPSDPPRALRK